MNVILSEKEKEVAILVSKGMKDKEIAQTLYISRRRVGEVIASIKEKWNINHRVEIGIWVYYHGWISIEQTKEEKAEISLYGKAMKKLSMLKQKDLLAD